MSESYVEVREDGAVRLAGTLAYPTATVDDVLTVQADGSIAAAAGGGSLAFTGWTGDDQDPQNVDTNGGEIHAGLIQIDNSGTRLGSNGVAAQWGDIQDADSATWGAEFAMPDTDLPAIQTYDDGFGNVTFKIFGHTAPADGALSAGECGLWYDATNGAAKLMVKAKTSDGSVVTGSVTLS